MMREVYCYKLGKTAEGLDEAPYPGEIGEKIYNHISKPAWNAWLSHQTMLINEYRLSLFELKARQFLEEEMLKFLFATGSEVPPGFVEPENN